MTTAKVIGSPKDRTTPLYFYQSVGYATTPLDTANLLLERLMTGFAGSSQFGSRNQLMNWHWPIQFQTKSQDGVTGSTRSWKQPLVFAHCNQRGIVPRDEVYNISSDPFSFLARPQERSGGQVYVAVNHDSIPASMNNTSGFAFLSPSALSMQPFFNLSSAFAFQKGNQSILCLISAWWIDSGISFSTSSSTILPEFTIDKPELSHMMDASSSVLPIDLDWLNTLDRVGVDNTTAHGYFQNMIDFCSSPSNVLKIGAPFDYNSPPGIQCLSTGIALLIAEGMARSTYTFTHHQITGDWRGPQYLETMFGRSSSREIALTSDTQLENFTRVTYEVTHNVYAYGFRSVTTYLAFTVLLLYVMTVAVHMSIIFLGERWSSKAWSGLGELLVLAFKSPSPSEDLKNTGGGVECAKTWRLRTTVEEVSQDNAVGLVVRDEESLRETWDVKLRSRALRSDSKYS